MSKAGKFLEIYHSLNWESYVAIAHELTSINKDNLEHELLIQARLYSSWHGLLSLAKKDFDKIKRKLETNEAIIKNRLIQTNSKLSDRKLDSKVKEDEEYQNLSNQLEEASYKHNLLQSLVKSLEHRKDMLVQISSNRKRELNLHN